MTVAEFRRIALSLPEAVESSHMDHPDFRVAGKVFATLGYFDAGWGMVKLTPEQQDTLMRAGPTVFVPAKGSWGRKGATCVRLKTVKTAALRKALTAAWLNTAPKRILGQLRAFKASKLTF
jgi:hypothetical protein